jgi:hypothetical protein
MFYEDGEAESPTDSALQTTLRQVIDEIFESWNELMRATRPAV